MSTHLLADTAEHPDFRRKLTPAQSPVARHCPCFPRERHSGVGLLEKNQHVSNLSFRPDRKLSFHIQTALKIILARHEAPITTHLHLRICQCRFQSVRDCLCLLTSKVWNVFWEFQNRMKMQLLILRNLTLLWEKALPLHFNGTLWSLHVAQKTLFLAFFS